MKEFYLLLKKGKSKVHALALAQRRLKAASPRFLPAQLGAFQLIGDIRPLGQITSNR
jgi:CHAT domain-containing protein